MRLILEGEDAIRLEPGGGALVVEAAVEGEGEVPLSPFHLLAASLAWCTWSVLATWGGHSGLSAEELELGVRWSFGGDPVRVSEVEVEVVWPSLPPSRVAAARRAAAHCTVHHTLEAGTRLETRVRVGSEGP
jgi:uncharacterized OsmC-like protein